MRTLVFDTETTGVKSNESNPLDPINPHIIQLAGFVFETDSVSQEFRPGTAAPVHQFITLVKCPIPIPAKSTEITGITDEIAAKYGVELEDALYFFKALMDASDIMVAHNLQYDRMVVRSAFARGGWEGDPFKGRETYCTMKPSTELVKAPKKRMLNPGDWKWPTLQETYTYFFKKPFSGAHDAGYDALAAFDIFNCLQGKKPILV